jgi:acetyl-CoA carboxylase beta subunit
VAQSRRSPDEYFASLVDADDGVLRIPAQARPWFRNDPSVESALAMVEDLATMEQTVQQCRAIVDELDAVVSGRAGINVFPQWREGWANAVEMLGTLTSVNADLVAAERELVWPSMSAEARARYEGLRSARETLERRYVQTPRTFTEMNERTERIVGALGEQALEMYRAELDANGVRAELDALRDIVAQRRRENTVDPNLAAAWNAELDAIDAEAEQHERAAVAFRDRIRRRQVEVSVADEVGQAEQQLRQQYMAALSDEAQFLAGFRGATGGRSNTVAAIDDLRSRSVAAEQAIGAFFQQMDQLVLETLASVRTTLAEETAALALYERRLAELQERASELTGAIAHRAFVETHRRFSDLTLRANLGIIDVAWERKEDVSDRIDELFEERNQALRILDADFTELLDGN